VRTPQSARDLICLTAVLSARDKAIIVSTQETSIPQSEYILKICIKYHTKATEYKLII